MANKFSTALKQRLIPDLSFVGPRPTNSIVAASRPPNKMSGNSGVRMGIGELLPTGGLQYVEDISTAYWFSALQPITPVAPTTFRPRQFALIPGSNLIWTPGEDKGGITMDNLRLLADSWDLCRLVLETRKDQICRLKWEIRGKRGVQAQPSALHVSDKPDKNIIKLSQFFDFPDGFHNWRTWIRMLLEDTLVLDALALYKMRDSEGRIANWMPIDGGTINRCLTDQGITPPPPSVAYQQVLYGSPQCNLTTDDLTYVMRNERTHRRYGYSPIEQILVTIGIGLRKQQFLVNYYTDGNMPEALCFLPANLSVDRVQEIQEWFDSVLAGDLQRRRRLTFLPGYGGMNTGSSNVQPNIVFPKEPLLKDELDDWLMRIVCYCFSVSPQNLVKQMNRASAEQSSTVSEEEGLEPLMAFIEDLHNSMLADMGYGDDYEWAFKELRDTDPVKAAQVDNLLVGKIYTINELRAQRGDEPRQEAEADMLGTFTSTGFIPISGPPQANAPETLPSGQPGTSVPALPPQVPVGGPALQKPATTITKVRNVALGELVHPVYGDLSSYDQFFAYDPGRDEIIVKGEVDLNEAMNTFRIQYPGINLNLNGHAK